MSQLRHIAIIMDGNGRWAELQGKKRIKGHEKGAEVVRDITKHCTELGIPYLTLYAFSTENWKRPAAEVEFLMKLLSKYLKNELPVYLENNIQFNTIGDLNFFSKSLQKRIAETKAATKACTGLKQILALNYGSKNEICRAVAKVVEQGLEITEDTIESHLDTAGIPPVDILIRTGGEQRLSNYLLWQSSYAELFFTDTYWPDFTPEEIDSIIGAYYSRERRFGGLGNSFTN